MIFTAYKSAKPNEVVLTAMLHGSDVGMINARTELPQSDPADEQPEVLLNDWDALIAPCIAKAENVFRLAASDDSRTEWAKDAQKCFENFVAGVCG